MRNSDLLCTLESISIVPRATWRGDGRTQQDRKSLGTAGENGPRKQQLEEGGSEKGLGKDFGDQLCILGISKLFAVLYTIWAFQDSQVFRILMCLLSECCLWKLVKNLNFTSGPSWYKGVDTERQWKATEGSFLGSCGNPGVMGRA